MLRLDAMSGKEYEDFLVRSVEHYAASVARTGVPEELAWEQARATFDRLLPDGLATAGALLRTARAGDDVVGWLWLTLPGGERPTMAWVHNIAVLPAHRGRGYGRAMMLAAEAELAARGVDQLGLNVFTANTTAVALYESLGYAVTAQQMAKSLR